MKRVPVGGRPLTPLHGGHIGLLCCAGLLNGIFGKGPDRHLVQWRTQKVSKVMEDGEDESGNLIKRTIQRFENDLAMVYANGRVQCLGSIALEEEAGEEDASISTKALDRMQQVRGRLFSPGDVHVAGSVRARDAAGLDLVEAVRRHVLGDWRDTPSYTVASNEAAVESEEGAIVSLFKSDAIPEDTLVVVTDADRVKTTVMLLSEFLPGEPRV